MWIILSIILVAFVGIAVTSWLNNKIDNALLDAENEYFGDWEND